MQKPTANCFYRICPPFAWSLGYYCMGNPPCFEKSCHEHVVIVPLDVGSQVARPEDSIYLFIYLSTYLSIYLFFLFSLSLSLSLSPTVQLSNSEVGALSRGKVGSSMPSICPQSSLLDNPQAQHSEILTPWPYRCQVLKPDSSPYETFHSNPGPLLRPQC